MLLCMSKKYEEWKFATEIKFLEFVFQKFFLIFIGLLGTGHRRLLLVTTGTFAIHSPYSRLAVNNLGFPIQKELHFD